MDREKVKELDYLAKRAIALEYLKKENYEKGLPLLKEIVKNGENKEDIKKFIDYSMMHVKQFIKSRDWLKMADIYKDIVGYDETPHKVYKNLGLCLSTLDDAESSMEFLKVYETLEPNDIENLLCMGELAIEKLEDFLTAIKCYEKALKLGASSFTIYNSLGHSYSRFYRDSHKEEQIKYFSKAHEMEPRSEVVVKNLAYVYGKFGEIEKADEMYGKMLLMNPSHSDLHSYGAYLVKNKRFKTGFKYLRHRFQKEDLPGVAFGNITKYKGKLWKIKEDLSGKRVLVHYEQGFGDSIMFIRFVKDIQDRCKSLEVVVQSGLVELFRGSNFTFPIKILEEIDMNNYDIIIPMMDLPLVCNLEADNIPYAHGYLSVSQDKIKDYAQKYIKKNKKFKIGFAFEGSAASLGTKRDVPLKLFYPLMKMENVDVYCFQVGDIFKQLDKVPSNCRFIRLADTFKSWEDTACAIKNMDLMISSDNGVMNLAGALGAETFGLFNSMTEWRWIKTKGDDIAWYKSVKPFQCTTTDDWVGVMDEVIKEVRVKINV